jgi:GT2 family glycosyltransferase
MVRGNDIEGGGETARLDSARAVLWQPEAMMAERNPLVVVVAYQNTESLGEALQLLQGKHETLVVDNGAEEGVRTIAERYGAVYLTPGRNVGFAAAVNLGISRRGRRHVLLLNPDARITPETVHGLVAVLEADPRLCAVAPLLLDDAGSRQRVEWPVPSPSVEIAKAFRLQRFLRRRETFLVGAVLMLRADALEDVGMFDERFFLYAEECDWQLRALRRGWRVQLVDQLQATHSGGGSSADQAVRDRAFNESAELFGLKWYGPRGWAVMRGASVVGATLRLVVSLPVRSRRNRYARELGI